MGGSDAQRGLCQLPLLLLAGCVTQCCPQATLLLIRVALGSPTWFFGEGMRAGVLMLCVTTTVVLRPSWGLVDFSLLPIGETHVRSGGKNPKGKKNKVFLGLQDPISPVSVIWLGGPRDSTS